MRDPLAVPDGELLTHSPRTAEPIQQTRPPAGCPLPVRIGQGLQRSRAPPLRRDLVVDLADHRLAQVDPGRRQDRQQRGPEGLERLHRFPDVEDVDATRALQREVMEATRGRAGPRVLQVLQRRVVLVDREGFWTEVDTDGHRGLAFLESGRGRAYSLRARVRNGRLASG